MWEDGRAVLQMPPVYRAAQHCAATMLADDASRARCTMRAISIRLCPASYRAEAGDREAQARPRSMPIALASISWVGLMRFGAARQPGIDERNAWGRRCRVIADRRILASETAALNGQRRDSGQSGWLRAGSRAGTSPASTRSDDVSSCLARARPRRRDRCAPHRAVVTDGERRPQGYTATRYRRRRRAQRSPARQQRLRVATPMTASCAARGFAAACEIRRADRADRPLTPQHGIRHAELRWAIAHDAARTVSARAALLAKIDDAA